VGVSHESSWHSSAIIEHDEGSVEQAEQNLWLSIAIYSLERKQCGGSVFPFTQYWLGSANDIYRAAHSVEFWKMQHRNTVRRFLRIES
jgi:hypothetical protein